MIGAAAPRETFARENGNNWSVAAATIARRSSPQREMPPAGWLATRAFAQQ
jgi:hypothetical protein